MLHSLCLNRSNMLITSQLIRISYSLVEILSSILTNSSLQLLRNSKELNLSLFLAASLLNLILESNNLLYFLVTKQDSLQDNLLRKLICTSLNHHYCITGTSNSQVEIRLLTLFYGRIDNELTINTAYTHASNWSKERNIRYSQCTGCTNHSCNLWSIIMLNRKNGSYNLNIISEALREQRANRTVDKTAAENCRLARTSFSLYKSARNLSYGVHLLFIIYCKREKVYTLSWLSRCCSGN